jgi:adenylate cyclase
MRFEETIDVAAPREAVWRFLANTDALSRELGTAFVQYEFEPRPQGGTALLGETKLAGRPVRYRERPFDWVRPVYYHVHRTYEKGPVREYRRGVELQPTGEGTTVRSWLEVEPSGRMAGPSVARLGRKLSAGIVAACRRFEEHATGRAPSAYPRHAAQPPVDRVRLEVGLGRLRDAGVNAELAARLGRMIAGSPPETLVGFRPYALADEWGAPRDEVLKVCLAAARAGLLELQWRILCPNCRSSQQLLPRLSELRAAAHCESCDIRYDSQFDRNVEVCFSVAPAVRPVEAVAHCIGGPEMSPHALAQWPLAPGNHRQLTVPLPPGTYRLTSLQAKNALDVVIAEHGARSFEVTVQRNLRVETTATIAAPDAHWAVRNGADTDVVLRVETAAWRADVATAAHVTAIQAFRDLFSSEVLSPGAEQAVRQVCVLFSDLKGSTRMYRELGDAPSYAAVRRHFEALRSIVNRHRGAIVKTIGDAVMAVFDDPADGLAAALAIQKTAAQDPDGLVDKLGLHAGPAIAVNANDLLDYFGQTVNVAARLNRLSRDGDVVVAQSFLDDPRVMSLLRDSGAEAQSFRAEIADIEAEAKLVRIRPSLVSVGTG